MASTKTCPHCGESLSPKAAACPKCGEKFKKPLFKRVWFWILIVVLVAGIGGALGGGKSGGSSGSASAGGKDASITVTNGKVSPSNVSAGKEVTIEANAAAEGMVFDGWVVTQGELSLADPSAKKTTFTMPSGALALEASYREADPHTTEGTKYEDKYTVSSELTNNGWSNYVEGSLVNKTDKKYGYIQITFTLYDQDGSNIGTALANAKDLGPGETWKFKAISTVTEEVGSYKFSEISAH